MSIPYRNNLPILPKSSGLPQFRSSNPQLQDENQLVLNHDKTEQKDNCAHKY